jgi:hypothetical protein
MCSQNVWRTNYDDIFLFDAPHHQESPFTRKIRAQEISTSTYVKNRDDYLFHYVKETLTDEFRHVLKLDCEARREQNQLNFWLKHQNPGFHTWSLGNSTFATAAGEVLYQYKCRPVLVKARSTTNCYQALPVEVAHAQRPVNKDLVDAGLFMEPLTHRLTTVGILVPCSEQFIPKYQNAKGTWTAAGRQLVETTAPRFPSPNTNMHSLLFPDPPNWASGGIYHEADMKDLQKIQNYGREREAFASTLIYHMQPNLKETDYLTPENLFPHLVTSPYESFKTKMLTFLHRFGETAAVFLAIYLIVRFIISVVTWVLNTLILRETHGCTRKLLYSICPSILLLRGYQKGQHNRDNLRELQDRFDFLQQQMNRQEVQLKNISPFSTLPSEDPTERVPVTTTNNPIYVKPTAPAVSGLKTLTYGNLYATLSPRGPRRTPPDLPGSSDDPEQTDPPPAKDMKYSF